MPPSPSPLLSLRCRCRCQVVYCLKARINQLFLRKMLEGQLDEVRGGAVIQPSTSALTPSLTRIPTLTLTLALSLMALTLALMTLLTLLTLTPQVLGNTVIIVDEVDDLVVNENPNSNYVKEDAERTPQFQACFEVLKRGEFLMPRKVHNPRIWEQAQAAVREAERKVEGDDYRVINEEGKKVAVILVDKKIPKVRLAALWLSYLNYKLSNEPPVAESPFATVCTPYVFNKYGGIFGLSGSVGGQAELTYLASTYGAVKFEVPRFLDTCVGQPRKIVINHGVEIVNDEAQLVGRVVRLCRQWVQKVPVLVITSGPEELAKVHAAVREADGIVADEVQRFSQFDEQVLVPLCTPPFGCFYALPLGAGCSCPLSTAFLWVLMAPPSPSSLACAGELPQGSVGDAHRRRHEAPRRLERQPLPRHRHRPLRRPRPRLPGDGQGRQRQRWHARDRDVGARRARVDPVAWPHRAAGPPRPVLQRRQRGRLRSGMAGACGLR